jgi:hypothetical protein
MKDNSTKRLVYLSVSINKNLLENIITDVSIAARIIDDIENIEDLSFSDLESVSRNLQLVLSRLQFIKESSAKESAANV